MTSRRELRRQLADAKDRINTVVGQRNDAISARDTALGNVRRMARQLTELMDELDTLRKTSEPHAGWQAERQGLRRELLLAKQARQKLDDQRCELVRANDQLSRDAVTAAGTLAPREVSA